MNYLHHVWFTYFYPSTLGNGPEDLLHLAIFAILGVLVYPPSRRFLVREWEHMHAKLDHIIEHSSEIPDFPKGRPKKP